jgi:DNA-binding CsgD family transcriptional regulator
MARLDGNEKAALFLLSEGASRETVRKAMSMSEEVVDATIKGAVDKMGANSEKSAISKAKRKGLIY